MKEALNQFMSDYLTNFRLSDFYPGPTCQITPPFLFAMVSVDVLLSLPQHNLMVATTTARVCVRAHDRERLSMTTPYQHVTLRIVGVSTWPRPAGRPQAIPRFQCYTRPGHPTFSMLHACNIENVGWPGDEASRVTFYA